MIVNFTAELKLSVQISPAFRRGLRLLNILWKLESFWYLFTWLSVRCLRTFNPREVSSSTQANFQMVGYLEVGGTYLDLLKSNCNIS
jgi:hypothetical protein